MTSCYCKKGAYKGHIHLATATTEIPDDENCLDWGLQTNVAYACFRCKDKQERQEWINKVELQIKLAKGSRNKRRSLELRRRKSTLNKSHLRSRKGNTFACQELESALDQIVIRKPSTGKTTGISTAEKTSGLKKSKSLHGTKISGKRPIPLKKSSSMDSSSAVEKKSTLKEISKVVDYRVL
eukprot:TRINITY_DN7151_c0_g1_i1.p1 TRINITY_DN7151_c0_g1~~TRINITY_DN7151_c0_g1_i1.p1  ORF type:complete len:182 (+),score=23.44 TRINITY_DN7151_c0_g1_i1:375-920(+)